MTQATQTQAAMTEAVGVTGWAWRTPLGPDILAVMEALWRGQRAIAPLSDEVGPHTYACKLCARIAAQPARSPHQRFVRRAGLWGLEAAHEAAAMAEVKARAAGGARVGVYVGYGGLRAHWGEMMPALAAQTPDQTELWRKGLRHLHPFWMLRYLSNNAHALFAADIHATEDGATLGGGTSGASALIAASRALRLDLIDVAVVFAYDSLLHADVLADLAARGRVSTAPTPDTWHPPYTPAAAGGIPGEAAAALVLERDPAHPLAWVAAAEAADGSPDAPSTATLTAAARALLPEAQPQSASSWLVDGAAQAIPAADAAERAAVSALFTRTPTSPPPTWAATGAAFGMIGAAQPLAQVIALGESLRAGRLPPDPSQPPTPTPSAPAPAPTAALGLSAASPGLAAAVRVTLSRAP